MKIIMSLLIVFTSAFGVSRSVKLFDGKKHNRIGMIMYYTNLSNLLVFVYFTILSVAEIFKIEPLLGVVNNSTLAYSVTMSIFITFFGFHFILARFGLKIRSTAQKLHINMVDNTFVHYITPLLTLANWFLFADKTGITLASTFIWVLFPLAYVITVVIYAKTGHVIPKRSSGWPYPYMNMDKLGVFKWVLNMLGAFIGGYALGLMFYFVAIWLR